MKNTNENIIVQSISPERKYVKVYHDFLDNSFLSLEEQMIFIVLKSYIDFKADSGEAFPSIDTLCKRSKMSKPRTIKAIKSLIKNGLVKKVRRGLMKTNVYTLADYDTMWACNNLEDVEAIIDNNGVKPLTPEEHIAALESMGYVVQIKEKGLESEPVKAQNQAPKLINIDIKKDTINTSKSQAERYELTDIKSLFDYNVLILDYPDQQNDWDTVFDILHETLNTTRPTIRIDGEDKPCSVVIGKLLKLTHYDIEYAVSKFHKQTAKITNVRSYLLTILYHAREQSYLELMNLGHRNGDF